MTGADDILVAQGVGKKFGGFVALNNVSVSFARDRLTAIIGPNGAGKSTFFNVISGAFPPSSGQRAASRAATSPACAQHEYARLRHRQVVPDHQRVPAAHRARERARRGADAAHALRHVDAARGACANSTSEADALLERVGIAAKRAAAARDLAHGEQRCLEIAMALACEPRLLLLDEPTAGMSPEETVTMMDLIVTLAQERTVVLVEHKMKLVMGICQQLVVLHHGELLAQGTPDDIRANDEVKRVYLGQGEQVQR